ncbi:MAG: type II toxin-antitoxin system Phd/YefM family antitoxin [Fibrobacteres bacterium]|nr:type II toxin-antitoxin system Phd/YefM family antitoxin [Fibrobacterota bacterium]
MKSMAISLFKAHALEVIDTINVHKESIVITNRGRPVVKVVPFDTPAKSLVPGMLSDMLLFENDIVAPIKESSWEANQ